MKCKTTTKILFTAFLFSISYLLTAGKPIDKTKWVPIKNDSSTISLKVDNFLNTLNGKMRLLHCKYDKANLIETNDFNQNGLKLNDEEWQSHINTKIVDSEPNAMDLEIRFILNKGNSKESGVAIAFDFENWDTGNYVLLPASVYNGNRIKIVDRGYATGLDRKYLYQKDIPLMSVPIPQLSPELKAISLLEVNASNLATPAMCFFSKTKERGFILLTEQKTQFADNGFIVEESSDRQTATFVVTAPGVRERKPEFVGFSEGIDRGADINVGDEINLKLRIYSIKATRYSCNIGKIHGG